MFPAPSSSRTLAPIRLSRFAGPLVYLFAIVCLSAWCAPGRAGMSSLQIKPINVMLDGKLTNIGQIDATTEDKTTDAEGNKRGDGKTNTLENTTFTLSKDFLPLLDCYSFHWFQVVTALTPDAGNPKYKGNPLAPPIVDTPNGGYDGQVGEDDLPWYLTLDEEKDNNKVTPAGATFHQGDWPSVKGASFDTWLVVESKPNPGKMFSVIAGFEWSTGDKGDASSLKKKNGTGLPSDNDLGVISLALQGYGFADWTAKKGADLLSCPEPMSITLCLTAGVVFLGARLRRRAAA